MSYEVAAQQWRLAQTRTVLRFADRMGLDPAEVQAQVPALFAEACLDRRGRLITDRTPGDAAFERRVADLLERAADWRSKDGR